MPPKPFMIHQTLILYQALIIYSTLQGCNNFQIVVLKTEQTLFYNKVNAQYSAAMFIYVLFGCFNLQLLYILYRT